MVKAFKPIQAVQLLLTATLFISACAQDSGSSHPVDGTETIERLPDDPTSEPAPIAEYLNQEPEESEPVEESQAVQDDILKLYDHLDPKNMVRDQPLREAVLYFHANKTKFANKNYISVIDFRLSSTKPRFFIINMKTGGVWALHTSHGKGSDANHDGYAERFSNVSGSHASSLGFYKTSETYYGSNGYSLRLNGLSSTNSNARARAIVVHGASYVQDRTVIQGRSWGCPAISMTNRTKVINTIKGGSLIYAVK